VPPQEGTQYPLKRRLCGPPRPSGHFGEKSPGPAEI